MAAIVAGGRRGGGGGGGGGRGGEGGGGWGWGGWGWGDGGVAGGAGGLGGAGQMAAIVAGARSARLSARRTADWPCLRMASWASRVITGSSTGAGSGGGSIPALTARSSECTTSSSIRVVRKSSRDSVHGAQESA